MAECKLGPDHERGRRVASLKLRSTNRRTRILTFCILELISKWKLHQHTQRTRLPDSLPLLPLSITAQPPQVQPSPNFNPMKFRLAPTLLRHVPSQLLELIYYSPVLRGMFLSTLHNRRSWWSCPVRRSNLMQSQNGGTNTLRTCLFVLSTPSGLPASPGPGSGVPVSVSCSLRTNVSFPRYSALKKHIYALEKQYAGVDGRIDDLEAATNERSTLLGEVHGLGGGAGGGHPADDTFSSLLDPELEKIVRFYREQEAELLREVHQLEADIAQIDADGPSMRSPYDDFDEDEEDEENLSPNAGRFLILSMHLAVMSASMLICSSSDEARYESFALARLD